MGDDTVSINMDPPDSVDATPKPPVSYYPPYIRSATPTTPYPLHRRPPLPRQLSAEPLQVRSQQQALTSRSTSQIEPAATRNFEPRSEPNYPTRPVFTTDPLYRSSYTPDNNNGPAYRGTSTNLPSYYPKQLTPRLQPAKPLSTTNIRGCACACHCGGDNSRSMSLESVSLTDDAPTSEDLSWRRLHMSRAKLKATATTSELLSGFAMVAMVELQINNPTNVPEWLFIMFSVCTTVLVAVHIFALMISTYLLPNIDAVSKLHVRGLVAESPHERMQGFIELAWAFSTVLGLFLFLVEVAILCWVKFWDYSFTAAWAATVIVVPVLVLFIAFAVHFYHNLVVYKVESSVSDLRQLEQLKLRLDTATVSSQA